MMDRLPESEATRQQRLVIDQRIAAYQATFGGPLGTEVLEHLSYICFANRTTASGDRDAILVAEGRRQVWLDIQKYLNPKDRP